jgi:hypothetical protein
MKYHIKIYTTSEELPQMTCNNFFHSLELFHIVEHISGSSPYMVVAFDETNHVVAHMLAIIRRCYLWFPPCIYSLGRIYGEGEYESEEIEKETIFGLMLQAATRKFRRHFCLYVEFSDLKRKMFAYQFFRKNQYFPIQWQEIHNSLHSKSPEDRISVKLRQRIDHIYNLGVETREIETQEELQSFYKMLHGFYRQRLRRIVPSKEYFSEFYQTNKVKVFITIYKKEIIGGCVCAYSEGNAYMWHLTSKKLFPTLHPNTMTVWHAIKYAYEQNYSHIFFMDVGLPWKNNSFRNFILSFGGKPVGMYQWFHFNINWINKILTWHYKK